MKPPFADKLHELISESWNTTGSIGCKSLELDNIWEIAYFPAVRELVGGPHDGEHYFIGFDFNIGKFAKLFDKPGASIHLSNANKSDVDHLLFTGRIDG